MTTAHKLQVALLVIGHILIGWMVWREICREERERRKARLVRRIAWLKAEREGKR